MLQGLGPQATAFWRRSASNSLDQESGDGQKRLFRTAGGGVVAICSICASLARATAEEAHWTYSGAQGPDHWGELAPEAKVCTAGSEQSPIDLTGAVPADLPKIEVSYKPQPLRVINNGHTIQVNFQPGSEIAIGKDRYTLLQYHFHHPSEHLVAGNPFAMELHLVHRHASGQLAVLGAFIKPGKGEPDRRSGMEGGTKGGRPGTAGGRQLGPLRPASARTEILHLCRLPDHPALF
jgi:hypothetical protein